MGGDPVWRVARRHFEQGGTPFACLRMRMMAHPGFQGAVFGLAQPQDPATSDFQQFTHEFLLQTDALVFL